MSEIDISVLQSLLALQEKTGKALLQPLFEAFSGSLTEQVPKLRISLLAKNYQELGAIAHTLKSSSANIGAIDLSQIFFKIESICDQEEDPDKSEETLLKLVNAIESTYQKTIADLKAAVEGMTAGPS